MVFLEGWFKDTLPVAPIEKLSVIRLDGDMYSSTMEAIEILYPKLSSGGFCVVDDYGLGGCKKAIDDYRNMYNITSEITRVDWTGVYWRKA
ncbi:MAG: O-methyltransferase [Gammaproteobacteria bacterium]|nr:MAG: O-methyltransferase [Gammaproteobacteria bacterium]TND06787.1 MAG: O-methyltransferase [Gammaproteobacteria bacterium]